MIFALDRNNNVSRNFCFICYKINYFNINCFNNLSKNARVNEIELENFNDENLKNV